MARNGAGVYSKPAGTTATAGTTIQSSKFNQVVDDLVTDANTARPVVAGGTGSTTATAARTALAVPGSAANDTVSGNWTFSGAPVFSGNVAFDTSVLYVDATNNRVGVGTATPTVPLDVVGAAALSSTLTVAGALTASTTLGVTGASTFTGAATFSSSATSTSPTAGVGYATGAGGTITQATNKTTGVTLNKVCGQITTATTIMASSGTATFTVTNSTVAATDGVHVWIVSPSGEKYRAHVTAVAAGSFAISLQNISGGSLSEAVVIGFAVIKCVIA